MTSDLMGSDQVTLFVWIWIVIAIQINPFYWLTQDGLGIEIKVFK